MVSLLDTLCRRTVEAANFNFHRPGEPHPDRVMDIHDIVFIREGGWEIWQDGERHVLERGDVIFLHAGHRHWGGTSCVPGVRTMFLHITANPADRLAGDVKMGIPCKDRLAVSTVLKGGDPVVLAPLFEDVIHTYWSDAPGRGHKLSVLADLLLVRLSEMGASRGTLRDALVEEALRRMKMTPGKALSLRELADGLHVCTKTLSNRFRGATGRTVHQYQTDLKLDMACLLIRDDPGRPFKDIAENTGFYDEFHFSRCFRRKFGYPPKALKAESRGTGERVR